MNKKLMYAICIPLGIALAIFGYNYFPQWIHNFGEMKVDGNLLYVLFPSAIIFLLTEIIPTKEDKELKKSTEYWDRRESKEKEYMDSILKEDIFMQSRIPEIFRGLKSINLILWHKPPYYSIDLFKSLGRTSSTNIEIDATASPAEYSAISYSGHRKWIANCHVCKYWQR